MIQKALQKIVSGGQTGTDRAALDVAIQYGINTGGWVPAGRRAEDGIIPERYHLTETTARNYATRTQYNVRDSDGTLLLNLGELDGGTLKTFDHIKKLGRPCLMVQFDAASQPSPLAVAAWLKEHSICVLNVAGPRESKRPGTYQLSFDYLADVLDMYLA